MRKHLETVRSKHPEIRTRIAIVGAFSITALVALIWITTLPVRFDTFAQESASAAAALQAADAAVGPRASSLGELFSGIQVTENPASNPPSETAPAEEYPAAEYSDY